MNGAAASGPIARVMMSIGVSGARGRATGHAINAAATRRRNPRLLKIERVLILGVLVVLVLVVVVVVVVVEIIILAVVESGLH